MCAGTKKICLLTFSLATKLLPIVPQPSSSSSSCSVSFKNPNSHRRKHAGEKKNETNANLPCNNSLPPIYPFPSLSTSIPAPPIRMGWYSPTWHDFDAGCSSNLPPIIGVPFQKLTLVESLACPVLRQSRPRLLRCRHHHRLRSSSSPQSIWSVMLFPGIHGRRADRYATSKMSSSPCQSPIRSLSLSLSSSSSQQQRRRLGRPGFYSKGLRER